MKKLLPYERLSVGGHADYVQEMPRTYSALPPTLIAHDICRYR
jgi:hypothetical protein